MEHGGARPGAGRKAATGEVRSVVKAIRFSPGEWAIIEEQAQRLSLKPCEYIRLTVTSGQKLNEEERT